MDYDKNKISSSSKPYIPSEERSYLERLIHRFSRRTRRRQEADEQAQAYAELTMREHERVLRLPSEERDREAREERQRAREERQRAILELEREAQRTAEICKLKYQEEIRLKKKKQYEDALHDRNNEYRWERQVGGEWILMKVPPPLTRDQQWEIDNLDPWDIKELEQSRRKLVPRRR